MKKGLIFLLGIMSILGVNTVNAEEIYLEYETNVNQIKPYIDEIGIDSINNVIYDLIDYYNENLSNDYPYFYISLLETHTISTSNNLYVVLNAIDNIDINTYHDVFDQSGDSSYRISSSNANKKVIVYNYNENFINDSTSGLEYLDLFSISSTSAVYSVYNYYYSNFDLYYYGNLFTQSSDDLTYLNPDDNLNIPYLDGSNKYSVHKANSKFLIEPYYLYDGNVELKEENYKSINLNDYSYVALSLKDYNTIPESNSSTYTNIYVKGQLCITPVYNYGLTERKDILSGTQMQGCSKYYDDFTLTRMYILKTDVQNHAIYYFKAYDTSKDNYVKIDSSKFNITYISSENENNPEVLINGKLYPTLPYGSLTDTSTKSEDEGYNSGVSCAVGDFNCYNENNPGNMIDSIFSSPLEFLKDIWSSVTSIFDIITEFLSLLPDTMQSFLYLSFMIAVILGLLKLIL